MRSVLAAVAIWFCAPIPALAQDAPRLPLVGVMRIGAAANNEPFATLFREALAALGDVEGRNLRLDFRFADGDAQRFPEMAEAFVQEKASVIVAFSTPAARAAQRATRTIPIIAVVGDFVAEGLGASLAKPGGNITGVSMIEPELETKRLEILKEMLPAARRNDRTAVLPARLREVKDGARALGVELQTVDVRGPADLAAAFETLRAGGAEAVNILDTSMLFNFRDQLGALASAYKLPAICGLPEMAAAGCLASYGTSVRELYSNLADLTDKMLKGASPADTPARQPTKFELVINLNVARAIGVTVPPSVSPVLTRPSNEPHEFGRGRRAGEALSPRRDPSSIAARPPGPRSQCCDRYSQRPFGGEQPAIVAGQLDRCAVPAQKFYRREMQRIQGANGKAERLQRPRQCSFAHLG